MDHEVKEYFSDWVRGEEEYEELKNEEEYKEVDEDIYVLLMDRAEGEALRRVRAHPPGEGVNAYRSVFKWFMGMLGQAIADKMRRLKYLSEIFGCGKISIEHS